MFFFLFFSVLILSLFLHHDNLSLPELSFLTGCVCACVSQSITWLCLSHLRLLYKKWKFFTIPHIHTHMYVVFRLSCWTFQDKKTPITYYCSCTRLKPWSFSNCDKNLEESPHYKWQLPAEQRWRIDIRTSVSIKLCVSVLRHGGTKLSRWKVFLKPTLTLFIFEVVFNICMFSIRNYYTWFYVLSKRYFVTCLHIMVTRW